MGPGDWAAAIVALAAHLAVGWFYLVSGLVAPLWAVVLLLAIWLVLLVMGYLNRSRPGFVLLIPVAAAVIWFVVIQGGSMLFGWTA